MAALVVLAVLALVAVGLVVVIGSRRRGDGIDALGVRRFFQYLLLGILFVVVAVGLTELLGRALGAAHEGWQDPSMLLARALAFVIIGVPLVVVLARWTWRACLKDPSETGSALLTLYVSLMLLISLVMWALALHDVMFQALGRSRFDGASLGQLIVWGGVWLAHLVAARRFLTGERATAHLLLGSLLGLVTGAYGMVATLGSSLDLLVRAQPLSPALVLAQAASVLIVGALVWFWYWPVASANRPRSPAWLAYVLLAGVGGGLILALTGASRALWSLLVWVLGDRLGRDAATHFDSTAAEAAMVVVGVLLWWYHRSALPASVGARDELVRIYRYLISGIALAAVAAGMGTVVVAFIEALTQGADAGMTTRNTLLAAVTLLAVGVPVWWVHWGRILAARGADPVAEVASPTRRIYLVASFGVAGLAAVVALLSAGYTLFVDVVAADVGWATLRSTRYALGVLLAGAAVAAYHAAVFRQDRAVATAATPHGPRSVVLVGRADAALIEWVHRETGARVELWEAVDPDVRAWDEAGLRSALGRFPGRDVVVVARDREPLVIEVARK